MSWSKLHTVTAGLKNAICDYKKTVVYHYVRIKCYDMFITCMYCLLYYITPNVCNCRRKKELRWTLKCPQMNALLGQQIWIYLSKCIFEQLFYLFTHFPIYLMVTILNLDNYMFHRTITFHWHQIVLIMIWRSSAVLTEKPFYKFSRISSLSAEILPVHVLKSRDWLQIYYGFSQSRACALLSISSTSLNYSHQ